MPHTTGMNIENSLTTVVYDVNGTYDVTKHTGAMFYMTWWVTLSLMGLVTNILTIITMRQPHFRKQPTSVFLLSLAVSDSMLTMRIITVIGNILNKEIWAQTIGLCR